MAITQEEDSPMAWMAKGKRSQPKHQPRCHQPGLFTTVVDVSTYTSDELEVTQSLLLLLCTALQSGCNPGPASALAPGSVNAMPDSQQQSHQCDECGKKGFKSLWSLRRHQTSHARSVSADLAKSDKEEVHRCSICQSEFQTGQALGGHKRAHYNWPNGRVRRVGSGSEANPLEVEKRGREEETEEAISDFQSKKLRL